MSEAREDQGHMPRPEKRARKQGTSWPAGQAVPEEWIAYGHAARKEHGLTRINLYLEADKFVCHWANGKPMKDWKLTWRKWCLRAWDGQPEAPPAAPQKEPNHPLDVDQRTVEMWRKGIRTANCGPQMLERAVEKGLLTPEQARRLGA